MIDLRGALDEALAAIADVDPDELDGAGKTLWLACEQRIEEIIEKLVREHDECGPTARAILARVASAR